jgi:hypothetical protein
MKLSVVCLQIVSALFLCVGIIKIRNFVRQNSTNEQINVCQLVQHFLAFGLYLLSALVLLYYFFDYYVLNPNQGKKLGYAYLVSDTLSFVSQLCLCWIFWQLSTKQVEN